MKKNRLYIGILACAALWTACSEEVLRGIHTEIAPGEVHFYGAIKKQSNIQATSRTTPNPDNYITLNETTEKFGTFYIWQEITSQEEGETTEELHYFQQYEKATGEQGNLAVVGADNEEGRLNWHDQTSEHTFYSWTQPNVTDDEQKITGGVDMRNTLPENFGEQESQSTTITGTVTYGTNGETNLEKFIVTKKGPISYDEWGQDVALYFERPIAKITLLGVIYIDANGAENANIQTCTLLFPNMYKTASFNPFAWNNDTQNVLSTDDKKNEKGIKWEWHKTTTEHDAKSLYVHPFQFGKDGDSTQSDDNTGIDQDPGFFIIQMQFSNGTKNYTGTLNSLNLTPTSATAKRQLNAGEHMQLYLTVTDGGGVGIGYQIINWNTEEEQTLPQYRIPGVYNEEDAKRLLEALQKAANNPSGYTFPEGVEDLIVNKGDEDNPQYEINLFTHIDWSSVEEGITEIKIPDGYTLKGNGYNVTLKNGVNITGTGDYKENLYINNNAPGVYSQTDADKLLTALTATEDSEKFPNGVKDLLVGSTINLFCDINWSSYTGTEAITIPDGYSLNGNGYNITLPNDVSITGNNIENLYVNGELYPNENGGSNTDNEQSESDATDDPTT